MIDKAHEKFCMQIQSVDARFLEIALPLFFTLCHDMQIERATLELEKLKLVYDSHYSTLAILEAALKQVIELREKNKDLS